MENMNRFQLLFEEFSKGMDEIKKLSNAIEKIDMLEKHMIMLRRDISQLHSDVLRNQSIASLAVIESNPSTEK